MSSRFGIASDRVLVHNSTKPGLVVIENGVIVDLLDRKTTIDAPVVDVGSRILMPALIDTNVHTADPGRAHWEGFASATAAAAAGGVAAVVDMPQSSSPPVLTASAVISKHSAIAGVIRVDVGFWGGVVIENLVEARPMADLGVLGFVAILGPAGFEDFAASKLEDLESLLRACTALSRPLLIRPSVLRAGVAGSNQAAAQKRRPADLEVDAIAAVIDAVRRTGGWAHLLSVSTAEALPLLRAARHEGLMVTAETCPHYLTFTGDRIRRRDTRFACIPPIRGGDNRDRLWEGLLDGTIDMITSDHTPSPPGLRTRSFDTTQPGIAALELRLPIIWTEASRRGIGPGHLARWLSLAPAALARIRSGKIEPGMRADLVSWDPDAEFRVDPAMLHQRHPGTPFDGLSLRGLVDRTWSAGRLVYAGGSLVGPPSGRILEQP